MNDQKNTFLSFLKKSVQAGKIALSYGFYPVSGPTVTKKDIDSVKGLNPDWHPAEKAALLREFTETRGIAIPQPLMIFIEKPFNGIKERKNPSKVECELCVINSNKGITESILIQASRTILESYGWKNTIVKINSIGSKESIAEFDRKNASFLRKRFPDFSAELRQEIKKDPLFLIKSGSKGEDKYKDLRELSPQTLDFLTEESRNHFKEILESMEMLGIPYRIDNSILGDMEYASETAFEIYSEDEEVLLAKGMRWNRLSKRLGLKKEVPAVSVSISAKTLKADKISILKELKPKFYLVQFGPEAKLKCLIVVEKLRKAGIPLMHSLAKDKLSGQIVTAESTNVPYIILLGQKEALENSVVVRNTANRSQVSVTIEELPDYVKKIDIL